MKKENKTSPAQIAAVRKYDEQNTISVKLKFNIKTDQDIIEQLNRQDNKQGYIKKLIRQDIKRAADHSSAPDLVPVLRPDCIIDDSSPAGPAAGSAAAGPGE